MVEPATDWAAHCRRLQRAMSGPMGFKWLEADSCHRRWRLLISSLTATAQNFNASAGRWREWTKWLRRSKYDRTAGAAMSIALRQIMPKSNIADIFDLNDKGKLQLNSGLVHQQFGAWPARTSKMPATKHSAVIARSRAADLALGDYGPPTTLFAHRDA